MECHQSAAVTRTRRRYANVEEHQEPAKDSNLQKPGRKCRNAECEADISKIKSPTHGLQFCDLRHHAITELAESQACDQTFMIIAGHVSPRMLAHYSHVRMDAKGKARDALTGRGSGGSYGHKPRHKFAR